MPARPEATFTDVCGVQAAFGSSRSGCSGNAVAQGLDGGHLLLGRKHAALEFDCGETVFVHDASSLGDDAVRVERLTELVGLATRVRRPLVEQVRAERHRVADRAAEQVGDRPARRVALHVEAGDLERREHLVDGAGRGDHAGRAHSRESVAAEPVGDRRPNRVEREHVQTRDGLRSGVQPRQVRLVGVGLAEADQSGVRVELDDGAQRVRLVHADGVEQRRVDERDRRDAGARDTNPAGRHGYTASVRASASTARPAAMIVRSSVRSSAVGMISGGRTGPAGMPSIATPALTRDTAYPGTVSRSRTRGWKNSRSSAFGQVVVSGFERVVERERQIGGERERGRRVQRHTDRAVGLLRGLRGRHAVEEQEVLAGRVGDRPDDARDLVEIAGAVLESDDVRDLGDRDGGLFGVAGIVAVVDDDGQVGDGGDLAGVGDQPRLRHLDEVRRQQQEPVGAGVFRGLREELGLGDRAAGSGVDGHASGDHLYSGPDDTAELLSLEGVEFACAAGDEDATRAGVDTLGDVAGQQRRGRPLRSR